MLGETKKTVSVAVLDDSHDEGSETMTLTLSSPSGAYLADGEATGTITNTDHMPQAWLARFGRSVADQVLDAVESRMSVARMPGLELRLAGQQVGDDTAPNVEALEAREAQARLESLTEWLHGETGDDRPAPEARALTGLDLLAGTSFALTGGSAGGGFGAVWGQGAVSRFDAREGNLTLDGEVRSATVGADFTRGRTTAGLAVAHSRGEGSFRSQADGGEVESTLTGLYPWASYEASERLSLWGVAGFGSGTFTLAPAGQAAIETDMGLAMAALGARSVLVKPPAEGGLELAATTDALHVRTTSDEVREGTTHLDAAQADVTRLRLGLEGSWPVRLAGGARLTPRFELGVRHDGGDAETGFGADVGAGIGWSDPSLGVKADIRARGLLAHESGGFRERGIAGSLAWDPNPGSDRGASLTLSQSVGAQATGAMYALPRAKAAGMPAAANDEDGELERRTLEARLGYGFALFGNRYTGTPELGLARTETGREMALGWRLAKARGAGLVFALDLGGTRRESAGGDPEHRLGLGLGWRLEGAGAERFELRFEGARIDAANDDRPKHRLGVQLTARW